MIRGVAPQGSFTVSLMRERIFLVEGCGLMTRDAARAVRAELDRFAALHPHVDRAIYDGTNVDGFEHGQAIEWIVWSRGRPRPSCAVAFVTSIHSAIAASATLRVMLPRLRFAAFATREPAIAFVLDERRVRL